MAESSPMSNKTIFPLLLFLLSFVACDKDNDKGSVPFCNCNGNVLRLNDTGLHMNFPTAFTPNSDGLNDRFHPLRPSSDSTLIQPGSFLLSILHGTDAVVFQMDSPEGYWDGTDFSGKELDPGTYYYNVRFATESGRQFDTCGCVVLIRHSLDSCIVNGDRYVFEDQYDPGNNTYPYSTQEQICP